MSLGLVPILELVLLLKCLAVMYMSTVNATVLSRWGTHYDLY